MNNTVGWPARVARFAYGIGAFAAAALAGCGGSSGSPATVVANAFPNAGIVIGQGSFTANTANQGIAPAANTLGNVYSSVAVDAGGNTLFISDASNSRVLGYSPIPTGSNPSASLVLGQTDFTSTAPGKGAAQFGSNPGRVSIGNGGQVVVADTANNRILVWNALPTSNGQQADVVIGPAVGASTTALSGPLAAMIAQGALFVADTGNNRVLVWNDWTTATSADPDFVIGQPDRTHTEPNGGLNGPKGLSQPYPAAAYTLNGPQDLWTDGFNLYVADTGNSRVLYYLNGFTPRTTFTVTSADVDSGTGLNPDGFAVGTYSVLSATGVAGQGNFVSATGQLGQTLMNTPTAIASNGTTFAVADSVNNRVLVFGNGLGRSSTAIPPTTIIGQENFNRSTANDDDQNGQQDGGPSQRTLNYPTGVAFGSDGTLYVTDTGNNRVLTFAPPY
jgi:hypothetical protein